MTKIYELSEGQIARQGDVMLIPVSMDTIPLDAKSIDKVDGATILAYGEVTGHKHQIYSDLTMHLQDIHSDKSFLIVNEIVSFVHEEHSPIRIMPGTYEVRLQKQRVRGKITRVAD